MFSVASFKKYFQTFQSIIAMAFDIILTLKRIVLPNRETVPRRKLTSQSKNAGNVTNIIVSSSFSSPRDCSSSSSSLLDESYLRTPSSLSASPSLSLSFALRRVQLAQGRPNPLVAILCGRDTKAATWGQRSGCCNRSLFSDRALTDCGVKRLDPIPNALFKLWRYRHRCESMLSMD